MLPIASPADRGRIQEEDDEEALLFPSSSSSRDHIELVLVSAAPLGTNSSKFLLLQDEQQQQQQQNSSMLHGSGSSGSSSGGDLASGVFNLATSIIGAGIMALPAAMKVLGLPLGIVSIVVMGILSEVSLEMVVTISAALGATSYGEMVHRGTRSTIASSIAKLAIIVNNGGILVVYLIIIGDVLSGSAHHPLGLLHGWLSRRVLLLVTMALLSPLCSLRRIDSLRYTSAASVILAILFVLLAIGITIAKAAAGKLQMPRMLPLAHDRSNLLELLTVIPVMTNAFICHFNIQPIHNELRDQRPSNMNKVGRISMLLCTNVYIATAIAGYLLFGDGTSPDVLSDFDQDLGVKYSSLWNDLARSGYVLHLMLVFPVVHFSLRQNVDELIFPNAQVPLVESRTRYWTATAVLLVLIYLGSTMIPNIWIAFQFTGATCGLSLGFIFPALLTLLASSSKEQDRKKSSIRCLAWTMLIVAGVSSILGLTTNIYNVATHHID